MRTFGTSYPLCVKEEKIPKENSNLSSLFTVSLTHGTEYRIALGNSKEESSGFMRDTSVKIFERGSVKQLCTTSLNKIKPRPHTALPMPRNTAREKKL